jgi:hypothetical protein
MDHKRRGEAGTPRKGSREGHRDRHRGREPGIGLIVLFVTYAGFNAIFNVIAPSSSDVQAACAGSGGIQEFSQRSQQAQVFQVLFFIVAAVEIIVPGTLAYKWRKPKR